MSSPGNRYSWPGCRLVLTILYNRVLRLQRKVYIGVYTFITTMIGTDVVGPTAIAAAETQVGSDLVLPAWARSILAIRPMVANATPTTLEPLMHKIHLMSDDFSVQPYEVLCAPTGGIIGTGSLQAPEPPWYPVNCPINGGDHLKVYGTELEALTVDANMMCQIVVSDKKVGAQIHAKVGVQTVTAGADLYAPGTPYTITGGNTLKEIIGMVLSTTPTTVEGVIGYFDFRSNDFKSPTPLKLPLNAIGTSITLGGQSSPSLSRAKVEVPIQSPCIIQDGCTLFDIPTAGDFITGVLYT